MASMSKGDLKTTYQWLSAVSEEFGISPEVTQELVGDILKMTADVAHNGPSRPAAPTTAFLVGLAAGKLVEDEQAVIGDVREKLAKVSELVEQYGQD